MSALTETDLAEWERLDKAALPGPWTVSSSNGGADTYFGVRLAMLDPGHFLHPATINPHRYQHAVTHKSAITFGLASVWYDEDDNCLNPEAREVIVATCQFAAAARTAVPALVAEVRRLQGLVTLKGADCLDAARDANARAQAAEDRVAELESLVVLMDWLVNRMQGSQDRPKPDGLTTTTPQAYEMIARVVANHRARVAEVPSC